MIGLSTEKELIQIKNILQRRLENKGIKLSHSNLKQLSENMDSFFDLLIKSIQIDEIQSINRNELLTDS